jgi:hypothetical protein
MKQHEQRAGLYAQISSYDTLMRGWNRLQTRGQAAGVDGVSVPSFAENDTNHLQCFSQELATFTYRPRSLRLSLTTSKTTARAAASPRR